MARVLPVARKLTHPLARRGAGVDPLSDLVVKVEGRLTDRSVVLVPLLGLHLWAFVSESRSTTYIRWPCLVQRSVTNDNLVIALVNCRNGTRSRQGHKNREDLGSCEAHDDSRWRSEKLKERNSKVPWLVGKVIRVGVRY